MDFRWVEWNTLHILEHGVTPDEAEQVVRTARHPYPRRSRDDKWLVRGRGLGGRLIQVLFVLDEDEGTVFVIHARPLRGRDKRRFRRGEK